MQNPNEDTEWNDILRSKGIIPEKPKEKEISEDRIVDILERTVKEKTGRDDSGTKNSEDGDSNDSDEFEDEEDERVLMEYRRKRIAEIQALSGEAKYGGVMEISAQDYVREVNEAGEGVWVILHLYKPGIPLCALINRFIASQARKYPATKFLKSVSNTCVPNWPDKNLPTIFIYHEGNMKKQIIGPTELRGMKLSEEEFEWMLGEAGAIPTKITEDPRPKVRDALFANLRNPIDDLAEENDW